METALYAHIPFCRRRCSYCDFNTWTGLERLTRPYVDALAAELELLRHQSEDWQVRTFYLGGGTPSLLPAEYVKIIVEAALPIPGAEISLESNPGTLEPALLTSLRRIGVNRLSIGMQSADPGELLLLGRPHDLADVQDAFRWARAAGFENINLDLIYGLPAQRIGIWRRTLDAALTLSPDHLSLYALTVEPETPLAALIGQGSVPPPDPDQAADLYDLSREELAAAGYVQYEISNWARPGKECRHNLAYWRNEQYLGAGAGAWGHWPEGDTGWRLRNVAHPTEFIERLRCAERPPGAPSRIPLSPASVEWEPVPRPLAMAETMFMGLRLVQEGVIRQAFADRFGADPVDIYAEVLADLARTNLIQWDEKHIFLPAEVILISNSILSAFLPEEQETSAADPCTSQEQTSV